MSGKRTIQNIMRTRRRTFCAASARMSICVQPIRRKAKIELIAESDGLFQVDEERLLKVNSLPEMMIATVGRISR